MPDFPVILSKEPKQRGARILSDVGRASVEWVKSPLLFVGCIVEEIPVIVERKIGPGRPRRSLQEAKLGHFAAELYRMAAIDLGSDIFQTVSPLIKGTASRTAQRIVVRLGGTDTIVVIRVAD